MFELGIYGGTFSPVHLGHIYAADSFYDQLKLDKLMIIPTFIPPHKLVSQTDKPYERYAMLKLAFEDNSRNIEISDYEINKANTSYTVETLNHFYSPDMRITFLMGTDMLLSFDKWYKPDRICSLARLAHVRRNSRSEAEDIKIAEMTEKCRLLFGADIVQLECPPFPVSSTAIRKLCSEKKNISEYVPQKVAEYIETNHLYGR